MDEKLMAWARAVKARRRYIGGGLPPLWVFTDRDRLPDPRALLRRLPQGLCGVVVRLGDQAEPEWAPELVRICRQRRFALVVAGDPRAAARMGAGRHLSGGWRPTVPRPARWRTAPAHGERELVRARRCSADAVFLSPVFATASHPGAPALGVVRWAGLAKGQRRPILALGGITGQSARRLPRFCAGAGVIGAASGLAFQRAAE